MTRTDLRYAMPLYRNDEYEFWALSRHEDLGAGPTEHPLLSAPTIRRDAAQRFQPK